MSKQNPDPDEYHEEWDEDVEPDWWFAPGGPMEARKKSKKRKKTKRAGLAGNSPYSKRRT